MKAERLPRELKRLPAYPLPILRIARLAVDRQAGGRGIGAQLLRHGLTLALSMSAVTGCVGALVDPKPGAEGFYRRFGFVATEVLEGETLSGSPSLPLFLSIQNVKSALA